MPAEGPRLAQARLLDVAVLSLREGDGRTMSVGQNGDSLPDDLERVLRDPTISVPRDHEVKLADGRTLWDLLQEWRGAPSNTASAD